MNFDVITTLQIILVVAVACTLTICLGLAFGFTSLNPSNTPVIMWSLGGIMSCSLIAIAIGSVDW